MKKLYKDDNYVKSELIVCRNLMGKRNSNLDKLLESLIYMYLYCSENMKNYVSEHIAEIERRIQLKD